MLAFVRDYWLAKRGSRTMPGRLDISPAQLKSQLPHILLIDVIDGGADFRYRLTGTQLRPFFPNDPVGKLMSQAIEPFGAASVEATLATYRAVIRKREPMRVTGSGAWFAQNPKYFDAMLAPLSDDGETVNMIFGAFLFDWDSEGLYQPGLGQIFSLMTR